MSAQASRTPLTLANLCACLSTERLGAYSVTTDFDSTDALARYLWNNALSIAFQPALHGLEITFRNALFRASQKHVNTTGRKEGVPRCWLDVSPSFLLREEEEAVSRAKTRLPQNPRSHTAGRLVAKLGFGFWTALCQAPYEHGRVTGPRLWPTLLPQVFGYVPKHLRNRTDMARRLDAIREWRNRIAHHEPIWDRSPVDEHASVLEMLGWVNPGIRDAVADLGHVEAVFHAGPAPFRNMAEQMLGLTP